MSISRIAFGSLAMVMALAGCNEAAESPSDSGFIACQAGQLHVEGDIDGTPVSLTQSTEGSGFSQFQTGEFRINDLALGPTKMNLTIEWSPTVPNGATSSVTAATLTMPTEPASIAFAGQTFCAGGGSQIRIPKDSENVADLQFNLVSLTGGTGCATANTGALRGCWRRGDSDAGAN